MKKLIKNRVLSIHLKRNKHGIGLFLVTVLCLSMFMFFSLNVQATDEYGVLGYDTYGSLAAGSSSSKVASRFLTDENGKVTGFGGFIRNVAASDFVINAFAYSDSDGIPLNLLGYKNITISPCIDYPVRSFSLDDDFSFVPNVYVWLGFNVQAGGYFFAVRYDAGPENCGATSPDTGTPDSTFGTPTFSNNMLSVWANYTVMEADMEAPTYSGITVSSRTAGQANGYSIFVADNVAPSSVILSTKTGLADWVNETGVSAVVGGATYVYTTNGGIVGEVVQYKFYVSDSSGNIATTTTGSFTLVEGDAHIYLNSGYYTFNSSEAGFLFRWGSSYLYSAGSSIKSHSNMAYELKPEVSFTVHGGLWAELHSDLYYQATIGTMGTCVTTVLANTTDYSLVKLEWTTSNLIHWTLYNGFYRNQPYVFNYFIQEPWADQTAFNSQSGLGFRSDLNQFYYTNYTGDVVSTASLQVSQTYPMFAGIDAGVSDKFPFMAVSNSTIGVTAGGIYLDASPNIRSDLAFWGRTIVANQYLELQVDTNFNEAPVNRWRNGTSFNYSMLFYVGAGAPTDEGGIIDLATDLFSECGLTGSVSNSMFTGVYGDWWTLGNQERALRGYTPYVANWIGTGNSHDFYVPYTASMFGSTCVTAFKTALMLNTGSGSVQLDYSYTVPSGNFSYSTPETDVGGVFWSKNNVDVSCYVQSWLDSDKLNYFGNVTTTSETTIKAVTFDFTPKGAVF
ncbi:MAG: hypothetical protein WC325_12605, partial [Candidatus Bathyarchaeia archaeon]